MLRASIIIPVFNNETTLLPLIRSLENQTLNDNEYEIIYVDGCSSDSTISMLKKYPQHENSVLIFQDKNYGIGSARNWGIKAAKSNILLFIDGDMEVSPDWAEKHIQPIENGEYDGAVGNVEYDMVDDTKFMQYLNRPKRAAKSINKEQTLTHKNFVFWNCAIKRNSLIEAGLFDENINIYGGEEFDVIYRVERLKKYRLKYNAEAKSIHHQTRTIERTFYLLQQFGKTVIPYLLEKYPELDKELHIHLLEKKKIYAKLIFVSFNRLFFPLFYRTYKILPDLFAFPIIKMMLYFSVWKGFQSREQS